ncbi:MAG: hypothetical protein AB7E68_01480 [Candidatus Babeliales bacterium]
MKKLIFLFFGIFTSVYCLESDINRVIENSNSLAFQNYFKQHYSVTDNIFNDWTTNLQTYKNAIGDQTSDAYKLIHTIPTGTLDSYKTLAKEQCEKLNKPMPLIAKKSSNGSEYMLGAGGLFLLIGLILNFKSEQAPDLGARCALGLMSLPMFIAGSVTTLIGGLFYFGPEQQPSVPQPVIDQDKVNQAGVICNLLKTVEKNKNSLDIRIL